MQRTLRIQQPYMKGDDVRKLQNKLQSLGFSQGQIDGIFGRSTEVAVRNFQNSRKLQSDGIVGNKTYNVIFNQQINQYNNKSNQHTIPPSFQIQNKSKQIKKIQPKKDDQKFIQPSGTHFNVRSTTYYPENTKMEGGTKDRFGQGLYTLQQYLKNKAPYVSVAMDHRFSKSTYKPFVKIPEIEQKFGVKDIKFKVVDTGGRFKFKEYEKIDICNQRCKCSGYSCQNPYCHKKVPDRCTLIFN